MSGDAKSSKINILMLGETGVGKSTFINGIANYLTYQTLEEAEQKELVSLIPIKFNITDDEFEVKKITSGEDDNEDVAEGQSATQTCRCYVFPYEEYSIRIIDTPGIGDVRGIEQDKKNMENLMSFLGQYDDLHAICILMKPNNARLTVEFQFCLKQLLCQLSKSASQNIVFVFTNARSTFYKPGESLPLLKNILANIENNPPHVKIPINKNTIFCLDNEAFRFLVTIRNGIRFTEEEKRDFAISWRHSFEESMRLINRVIGDQHQPGLAPHKIKDTLSVNEARQAIINLSKPLAEISDNIQDNLKIIAQNKQHVENNSDNIEELKKKRYVFELDLNVKKLSHPRTVCAHKDCTRSYQVAGLTKRHYAQTCHENCYLEGVPREMLGDPNLKGCRAMRPSRKTCNECQHGYEIHMHIYYETEVVEKETEDENIIKQIKNEKSAKALAEAMISSLELKRNNYEKEQNIITKAMAKFGCFLKVNAIAPYNDSFKNYLEHLIENEKSLSGKAMNNKDKVEGLERMLCQYDEEVKILDQAINMNVPSASSHIDSDEIFKTIEELFDLELTGRKIMKLYKNLKKAKIMENLNHRQVVYKPKNQNVGENAAENFNQYYQRDEDSSSDKIEEMIKRKSFRYEEDLNIKDKPHPKPAERASLKVRSSDQFDNSNSCYDEVYQQRASAPVEDINYQAGPSNFYPFLPPVHSYVPPANPYQPSSFGYWNNQVPQFVSMPPQQYQYPYSINTPPAVTFQSSGFSPPPNYEDASKSPVKDEDKEKKTNEEETIKVEEKTSSDANESEAKSNDNVKEEEICDNANESERILTRRLEETEKRIQNVEILLEKLLKKLV